MSYRVEIERRAAKQIAALQDDVRERVLDVLHVLQHDPRPQGCSKLKGRAEPAWRVRIGDYRILYRVHDDQRLVRVYGVLKREEAYRG